ncbi:MAG: hypothetical protein OEZ34_12200 [Spirochaetia bacterium]|nr:hypothetical protein [Spirochaetia bacterium]
MIVFLSLFTVCSGSVFVTDLSNYDAKAYTCDVGNGNSWSMAQKISAKTSVSNICTRSENVVFTLTVKGIGTIKVNGSQNIKIQGGKLSVE